MRFCNDMLILQGPPAAMLIVAVLLHYSLCDEMSGFRAMYHWPPPVRPSIRSAEACLLVPSAAHLLASVHGLQSPFSHRQVLKVHHWLTHQPIAMVQC